MSKAIYALLEYIQYVQFQENQTRALLSTILSEINSEKISEKIKEMEIELEGYKKGLQYLKSK